MMVDYYGNFLVFTKNKSVETSADISVLSSNKNSYKTNNSKEEPFVKSTSHPSSSINDKSIE